MFDGESGLYGVQRKSRDFLDLTATDSHVVGEMRDSIDGYLQNSPSSIVRSLKQMIEYNNEHPEQQAGISKMLNARIDWH